MLGSSTLAPMKILACFLGLVLPAFSTFAENHTTQSPITMEQLMRELQIQGGNWTFTFDRPVFAKVVCVVSRFSDGKSSEVTEFISDRADSRIDLFFMASPWRVGDYAKPHQINEKTMKVRLSNCRKTDGTRIIHYIDKFAQQPWIEQPGMRGEYKPSLPLHPELNKEYVLHYYFKEGDPYEAKATICFLEKPEDASKLEKHERNTPRRWKAVDDE